MKADTTVVVRLTLICHCVKVTCRSRL